MPHDLSTFADAAPAGLHVIILAAGTGSRLGTLGGGEPKALLPLAQSTLIARAIAFADGLGAARIVVVGGHGHAELEAHVAGIANPRVKVVENPAFRAGNLLTLRAALPHVEGPVLLANVDHVFPPAARARITSAMGDAITVFCQFERALADDEMKVVVDGARNLRSIAKTLASYDGGYIGLTYVPRNRLERWIDAIGHTAAAIGDAAVAEQVLQHLADQGEAIHAASLDGIVWAEIDTPADFARAQALCANGAI